MGRKAKASCETIRCQRMFSLAFTQPRKKANLIRNAEGRPFQYIIVVRPLAYAAHSRDETINHDPTSLRRDYMNRQMPLDI